MEDNKMHQEGSQQNAHKREANEMLIAKKPTGKAICRAN